MLQQTYGYMVFEYHDWYKGEPKQVTDRICFTIRGRNQKELDAKYIEKVDEIMKGLDPGQYPDDFVWTKAEKVREEDDL